MPLDPGETEIVRLIEEAAAATLDKGRGTITIRPAGEPPGAPTTVILAPTRDAACPLKVGIERRTHLFFWFGPHASTLEESQGRQPSLFRRRIREIVKAVTEGRYEEWIRTTSEGRQAVGDLFLESEHIRFRDNALSTRNLHQRGYKHFVYMPY
jgi:hypothetical protein